MNLKIKQLLVDFVTLKYPDNYELFTNLFDKEENLLQILKTIDENWVEATPEKTGLFSYNDKILLTEISKNLGINLQDLGNDLNLKNVRNIIIPENSLIELTQDQENNTILDINNNEILKLIKFDSEEYNAGVKIELNEGNFEIRSRNVIYISDTYKTNYTIDHNLGTNINVNLYANEGDGWEPIFAKYIITNNKVDIFLKSATKLKIHLTLI